MVRTPVSPASALQWLSWICVWLSGLCLAGGALPSSLAAQEATPPTGSGSGAARQAERAAPAADADAGDAIADADAGYGAGTDDGDDPSGDGASYGATAHVESVSVKPRRTVTPLAQDLPGTFGDPFRVVESLPGTLPLVSGVPYVYVRGAPPSGTSYYYDDIPLPHLYHLGLGPAVMHPAMLGPIEFEPGVGTARYGRRLGAVLRAEAPTQPSESRLWLEARVLDANAFVAKPLGKGTLMAAGRFGYPGLVAPLVGLGLRFSYWDYQLRLRQPVGLDDFVEVIALGSYDVLDDAAAVGAAINYGDEEEKQRIELEFHRLEGRLVRRRRSFSMGLALRVGYDASEVGADVKAEAYTVAPRVWYETRFAGGHRLELGADLVAASGRTQEVPLSASFAQDAVSAVSRHTGGAYLDAQLQLTEQLQLSLGVRTDVWLVSAQADVSVDPRARVRYAPSKRVAFFAGAGLNHQPVVFALPLPGFTDVALDRGLQESLQTEVGAELELPADLHLEAQLFFHRYTDLLLPEVYLRALGDDAERVSSHSYGVELFVSRPSEHVLSGFVSYTLGFAEAVEPFNDRTFKPEFDVRHVLNLVMRVRLGGGWALGGSLRARSGKPANQFTDDGVPPYYSLRLPAFVRLDPRLSYEFEYLQGLWTAYVEVLNTTLSREVVDAECFFGQCTAVPEQPIWFPNVGVRAQF